MPARFDKSSVRVLVVEDDENNRIVISRLLRLAGVDPSRILEAPGDPAALLAGAASGPGPGADIVFLDLQMPRKDGYRVLAELRANEATKGLVVIALTANVMRQDVERCRAAGFDGFIGKPIDGRRFGEIFARILDGESVWTVV